MKILATKPDSLIEWPGHLSYTIFIAGCNLSCPFCYVPHLVKEESYKNIKEIEQEKILQDLAERKGFIDAICITGGEPTIHPELLTFLKKIKEQANLPIRLETNGTNPKMIKELIDNKLIDSIALDIKNCKEKYQSTVNTTIDIKDIEETLSLIKNSNIDYELRTTLVPGLHELADIIKIAKWLNNIGNKKIKLYLLQQFRADLPQEQTINQDYIKKPNYPFSELENIKKELEKLNYFEKIEIRGD